MRGDGNTQTSTKREGAAAVGVRAAAQRLRVPCRHAATGSAAAAAPAAARAPAPTTTRPKHPPIDLGHDGAAHVLVAAATALGASIALPSWFNTPTPPVQLHCNPARNVLASARLFTGSKRSSKQLRARPPRCYRLDAACSCCAGCSPAANHGAPRAAHALSTEPASSLSLRPCGPSGSGAATGPCRRCARVACTSNGQGTAAGGKAARGGARAGGGEARPPAHLLPRLQHAQGQLKVGREVVQAAEGGGGSRGR